MPNLSLHDALPIYLLEVPARRAQLGTNARAFVRANYDLQTVCLPRQLDWVERLAALQPRAPRD